MSLSPSHKSTLKEIADKLRSLAEDESDDAVKRETDYPEGIVAFKISHQRAIYKIDDALLPYQMWCDFYLKHIPHYTIHSVKNSAGEILTLGDEVQLGKIKALVIANANIYAIGDNFDLPIDKCHPKPARITEYGHPIIHNKTYHIIDKNFKLTTEVWGDNDFDGYKVFASKTSAEKYIEDNKPRFSKQQILDVLNEGEPYWIQSTTINKSILKQKLHI